MIVMKFGGSSVKNALCLKQVFNIVLSYKSRKPIVVLSACSGITDKLLKLNLLAATSSAEEYLVLLEEIAQHHFQVIDDLFNNKEIKERAISEITFLIKSLKTLCEGVHLLKEATENTNDLASAFGELLSTCIFHHYCLENNNNSKLLDSRNFICVNSKTKEPNFELTKQKIQNIINWNDADIYITQGFIASNELENSTTLGRGGSDYSASIIGSVLKAEEIQIWTDVSGVLSADPKYINTVSTIKSMSFEQIRILSYFGAKVLHPETIKPAMLLNIPVRVLNTFEPQNSGTLITAKSESKQNEFLSVHRIEKCIILRYKLLANSNYQDEINKALKEISEHNLKIFWFSALADELFFIIEHSSYIKIGSSTLQDGRIISISEKSLLLICGSFDLHNKLKNKLLENLEQSLSEKHLESIIFGLSENSVICVVTLDNSLDALIAVHSIISNK